MNNRAVLLANLGSPDAPEVPEVRKYLKQFLMDPYVIQLPWPLRALIVNLFVLPKRPYSSAEAYRSVWTDDGSPLVHRSHELLNALKPKVDIPVAIAMRYGKPSIESQIKHLASMQGIDEILFIPLLPHLSKKQNGSLETIIWLSSYRHSYPFMTIQLTLMLW
jgi:ferrochelatase